MSRIKSDRLGIVQRGKRHRLLQILQDFLGDSLMLVEQRSGMHHPVANRVDRRHAGPAHRILQQRHRILVGCIFGLRSSTAQLPPLGIAKGEPEGGSAHPADFAGEQSAWPGEPFPLACVLGRLENGKFDRRRTTIDNQYVHTTTRPLLADSSKLHPPCMPQMNSPGACVVDRVGQRKESVAGCQTPVSIKLPTHIQPVVRGKGMTATRWSRPRGSLPESDRGPISRG